MIEKITYQDSSQLMALMKDITESKKYGEVKSLTFTDTGNLIIITDKKQIALLPELQDPTGKTDFDGAFAAMDGEELDGIFAMMATLMKAIKEMKKAGMVSREVEHQIQQSEMQRSAEKMRQAGVTGAIIAGISLGAAVVMSAVNFGLALVSTGKEIKATKANYALKEAQQGIKNVAKEVSNLSALKDFKSKIKLVNLRAKELRLNKQLPNLKSNVTSLTWKSGIATAFAKSSSQLQQPAGQAISGVGDAIKANIQADGEMNKIESEKHQFQAQKESEQLQALQEMLRNLLDKLKTIIELKQQAASTATQV